MSEHGKTRNVYDTPGLYRRAVIDAFIKLDPRTLIRNPVMFTVEVGSVITTLLWLQALTGAGEARPGSSEQSRSGSGSPYCLRTLPKPLLKAGERHRPTPCVKCGRTQQQKNCIPAT